MIFETASKNPLEDIKKDYKKIVITIQSLKTEKQAESVEKLITNFIEKYKDSGFNIGDKGNITKRIDFDRKSNFNQRVKELRDELKKKLKSIIDEEKIKTTGLHTKK